VKYRRREWDIEMPAALVAYWTAWNERDLDRVRGLLELAVTTDVVWNDPRDSFVGIDELETAVRRLRSSKPEYVFTIASEIDHHHDRLRYRWNMSRGSRTLMEGLDIATIDEATGLIARVDGFFGHPTEIDRSASGVPAALWVAGSAVTDPLPERRFGWSDMFVSDDDDPRADGGWENDERAVLLGSLRDRRLTLEMKCGGLNAAQMAQQSVPPSDLSLLGIVRHLTSVESYWFRNAIAGTDDARPYRDAAGADQSFVVGTNGEAVTEAWSVWRAQIETSEAVMKGVADLGQLGAGNPMPVREVLVHVIREYAQHLGHADLLRECIDGRVGQ